MTLRKQETKLQTLGSLCKNSYDEKGKSISSSGVKPQHLHIRSLLGAAREYANQRQAG